MLRAELWELGYSRVERKESNNPIANALEGAYDEKEGDNGPNYTPRCDAQGINMFANVVRDFPDFPFSHWALALCFAKESNPQWRTHAERAKHLLSLVIGQCVGTMILLTPSRRTEHWKPGN